MLLCLAISSWGTMIWLCPVVLALLLIEEPLNFTTSFPCIALDLCASLEVISVFSTTPWFSYYRIFLRGDTKSLR